MMIMIFLAGNTVGAIAAIIISAHKDHTDLRTRFSVGQSPSLRGLPFLSKKPYLISTPLLPFLSTGILSSLVFVNQNPYAMKTTILLLLLTGCLLCTLPAHGQFSREDAFILVQEVVIMPSPNVETLVAYSWPELLQPGELVYSAGEPDMPFEIAEPAWFFWIDDLKDATFAHPTRFVFVGEQSGELFVSEQAWWPAIGETEIWDSALARSTSTNVVFGEPVPEPEDIETIATEEFSGGDGTYERVCIYIISGVDEASNKWAKADKDNMEKSLKKYFGEDNIAQTLKRNNPTMMQVCDDLKAMATQDEPSDKIVFYFTGHANSSYLALRAHPFGNADRQLTAEKLEAKLDDFNIPVWVILFGCEVEGVGKGLNNKDLTGHALVAAAEDKPGMYCPASGSYWTTYLAECLNNMAADGNDEGTSISPQEAQDWAEKRLNESGSDKQAAQNSSLIELKKTTGLPGLLTPTLQLQLYPNPTAGPLSVAIHSGQAGAARLRVYDTAGRILQQQVLTLPSHGLTHALATEMFSPGTYLLEIRQNGRYGTAWFSVMD